MAQSGTNITHAAQLLAQGQLVGMPTETVYGLAANAFNAQAVSHIFEAKNRPSFDPLIVHVPHTSKVLDWAATAMPPPAMALAQAFWPGPLTLLLPVHPNIPPIVTSGLPRVAVRVPSHPLALELLEALPFPLAAPSANPFGYISPTTAQHVLNQLGSKVPYVLNGGPATVGVESTIVGFEGGQVQVHRFGGIAVEAIEQVVGPVQIAVKGSNPAAPGMLDSHYAPRKPLLLGQVQNLLAGHDPATVGTISLDQHFTGVPKAQQVVLSSSGNLAEAARNLFEGMRMLDQQNISLILAAPVPNQGLGRAINDRLQRAAGLKSTQT